MIKTIQENLEKFELNLLWQASLLAKLLIMKILVRECPINLQAQARLFLQKKIVIFEHPLRNFAFFAFFAPLR